MLKIRIVNIKRAMGRKNILPIALKKGVHMDSKQYNDERHKRKVQLYHISLGFQQLKNYPWLNLVWILFAMGIWIFARGMKWLVSNLEVCSMVAPVFYFCTSFISILFPIILAMGIIRAIGEIFSIKDEADMMIIFNDNHHIEIQQPILMYKEIDRKLQVIKREFYTTISMERWQEKKNAICDRMDIHLIGDITYGGKKKNKGNRIYFESAKGRKTKERGILYDDEF